MLIIQLTMEIHGSQFLKKDFMFAEKQKKETLFFLQVEMGRLGNCLNCNLSQVIFRDYGINRKSLK